MSAPPQRPLDEFYIGEPNSGCWLWLGNINRDGFNIHYVTVHEIKSGKKWKHLEGGIL